MSELIQKHDNRTTIRWKLLTGASALALTAYVSSAVDVKAEDTGRPEVWIELGGQMEQMQGLSSTFTAPFMSITPAPGVYDQGSLVHPIAPVPTVFQGNIFADSQRPPRFSFGVEGKISFQPDDSNWIFSAGVRYGRSNSNRHHHRQTYAAPMATFTYTHTSAFYSSNNVSETETKALPFHPFADARAGSTERHAILDFMAGKDVGLGLFGHQGSSTLSAGVRIASFKENSAFAANGRPEINGQITHYTAYVFFGAFKVGGHNGLHASFYNYNMSAHAERRFKGIGPTVNWNASAAIAGNEQDGELALDWGINAALLFGKQRAKVDHTTQGYHNFYTRTKLPANACVVAAPPFYGSCFGYGRTRPSLTPNSGHGTRSRSVSVPNLGGYVGLSMKYSNAKISIGYRYDTFLNAMDTGIDAMKKSNLTFNGPYASISIGLGD